MSTPQVLQDSLAIAAEEGLQTALLPPWYDVDNAADLQRVKDDLAATDGAHFTQLFLQDLALEPEP